MEVWVLQRNNIFFRTRGAKDIDAHLAGSWAGHCNDSANSTTPSTFWKQHKCARTNNVLGYRQPGEAAIKDGLNTIVELSMLTQEHGVEWSPSLKKWRHVLADRGETRSDAGCMAPIAGIQPCRNSASSMRIQRQKCIADVLLMCRWRFTQKPQSRYGDRNTSACTEKASWASH